MDERGQWVVSEDSPHWWYMGQLWPASASLGGKHGPLLRDEARAALVALIEANEARGEARTEPRAEDETLPMLPSMTATEMVAATKDGKAIEWWDALTGSWKGGWSKSDPTQPVVSAGWWGHIGACSVVARVVEPPKPRTEEIRAEDVRVGMRLIHPRPSHIGALRPADETGVVDSADIFRRAGDEHAFIHWVYEGDRSTFGVHAEGYAVPLDHTFVLAAAADGTEE